MTELVLLGIPTDFATLLASTTKNFAFLFAKYLNYLGGNNFSIPSTVVSDVFNKKVPPFFKARIMLYFSTYFSFAHEIKSAL